MKTLTELANEYKSDKGTNSVALREAWGRGMKDEVHGYSIFYDKLFKPYKKTSINFLEIGIADWRCPGASLKMWYEYFPQAQIYGYDNFWSETHYNKTPPNLTKYNNDRTRVFVGDQGNRDNIEDFCRSIESDGNGSGLDLIVEDGSHFHEHQIISLGGFFPYLTSGGIYIIEDIQIPGISNDRHGYNNIETLNTLVNFQQTGVFKNKHLLLEESEFLTKSIQSIELLFNQEYNYMMAVIIKKELWNTH